MSRDTHSRRWLPWLIAVLVLVNPLSSLHAAAVSEDERMIIASSVYVETFDASTVRIAGPMRIVRMHLYLPKPDEDGITHYEALEEIDCVQAQFRYTAGLGHRPNGTTEPQIRDHTGFDPIGKDTPIAMLRDHMCKLKNLKAGTYGVVLEVSGIDAARAVFELLKLGLDSGPAAELASQSYGDRETLRYSLDRQEIAEDKRLAVIAGLGPLVADEAKPPPPIVPLAAAVRSGRAGRYILNQMEMGAGIWLKLDGTFEYGLTVGSLDETARGTWAADGDRIILTAGAAPLRRSDVDFKTWQVTAQRQAVTIVRDGQTMVFERQE